MPKTSSVVPIDIPPGVVAKESFVENGSSWREANFFRWVEGRLQPVGGWQETTYTPPSMDIRAIHRWRDNSGRVWKAYLTEDNIYVEFAGDLVSINPTPAMEALGADFLAGGYGDGDYGYGDYGTARPDVVDRQNYGPAFTMDNWGENLEFMSSVDGRLLEWVPPIGAASPSAAAKVLNSPPGYTFVVTPERHIIVFGASGETKYAWCDKEDNTNWTAGIASEAGELPIEPASPPVAARNLGEAGTIFWTLKNVYISNYIGLPYIYNHDDKAEGTLPISAQSVSRTNEGAVWPSDAGWWIYNGVSVVPLDCNIWDWIIDNMDVTNARQNAAAVHLIRNSEIWWFFPSTASGPNDRVAIFNYRQQWWSQGLLTRTAGFSEDMLDSPIMASGVKVFEHEAGAAYADLETPPYIETFSINVATGTDFSIFRQLMPEFKGDVSRVSFQLYTSITRSPEENVPGPKRKRQANGMVDFMQSGRDFRLRISADDLTAADWAIKRLNVDIMPKGKKK